MECNPDISSLSDISHDSSRLEDGELKYPPIQWCSNVIATTVFSWIFAAIALLISIGLAIFAYRDTTKKKVVYVEP
jgi:hypothetical protein